MRRTVWLRETWLLHFSSSCSMDVSHLYFLKLMNKHVYTNTPATYSFLFSWSCGGGLGSKLNANTLMGQYTKKAGRRHGGRTS